MEENMLMVSRRFIPLPVFLVCMHLCAAGAAEPPEALDAVKLGDAAAESAHGLQGEKTQTGVFQGRPWREARDGGWFSYRMRVVPDAPVALRCTYWGNNFNRVYDFLCDGRQFAAQIENFDRLNAFWTAEYPLPLELTRNKREVLIKLQARPGKAGGVFSWEIVRVAGRVADSPAQPPDGKLETGPKVRARFAKLPLGSVKPEGWLKRQLRIQADGLTGYADELVFTDSEWKGGKGNKVPGPPYRYISNYLEGLVPLAWLLDDARLQAKSRQYIECLLAGATPDGWFGPPRQDENEEGATNNPEYLACALKMLIEYAEATGDPRVLPLAKNYLRYVDRNVQAWRREFWWGTRSMEHAIVAYWVYEKTRDPQYLAIADRIHGRSGYPWSDLFAAFPWDEKAVAERRIPLYYDALSKTAHGVALAWAVKYPALRYLCTGAEIDRCGSLRALEALDRHHGQAAGRFSCDEMVSGRRPTRGTELCTVIELAYSLEKMVEILGEPTLADQLETLVYNAIPGTMTPDCWAHQYDQQSNQVKVSNEPREWINNGPQANLYGLYPNYPCCLGNMHHGWPRFVEHLWMASGDGGLAAVAFGPSTVSTQLAGVAVTIREETEYPFDGTIRFIVQAPQPVRFPLVIRIPAWSEGAVLKVGAEETRPAPGTWARLDRTWKPGDVVELSLPMTLRSETRYNNSVSLLRGPLYFSLRIGKDYKLLKSYGFKGAADWAIHPTTPWNYGLALDRAAPGRAAKVVRHNVGTLPFGDRGDKVFSSGEGRMTNYSEDAPVVLRVPAKKIAAWGMHKGSCADPPTSPVKAEGPTETVELVPYGCTRLRITEFPVLVE
jgi:hypothetical protein